MRQDGVVARRQLDELGFTRRRIERALERGDMRPLVRGVYLLGPFQPPHAREMAAVLACGPAAWISHRSAASLLGLLQYPKRTAPVDVTVTRGNPSSHGDLRVHHTVELPPSSTYEIHGIPVTAPPRTLIDVGGICGRWDLEAAVAEAFALRLTNRAELRRAVTRAPGRRGVARLRALIGEDLAPKRTRSAPERKLLHLIRGAGLPEPQTNVKVGRWEVDFFWPAHALVVEVDGYAAHSSPWAFERDHRKGAELIDLGLVLQRASANQIRDEPELVVARIRRALAPPSEWRLGHH